MATKDRPADVGDARGRSAVARIGVELRVARVGAGLSQSVVAKASRLSRTQISRIERGRTPELSIRTASRIFAVLGLDLSVKAFPAGDPIRDAAQVALLERLRGRCHPSLTWRTEEPLAIPGDRRAWDAVVGGVGWRAGVEAETALSDLQAMDRRLALKERDGGVDRLILLLLDSRRNRQIVASVGDVLRRRFPVPGGVVLERLAAGADPGGNAFILL